MPLGVTKEENFEMAQFLRVCGQGSSVLSRCLQAMPPERTEMEFPTPSEDQGTEGVTPGFELWSPFIPPIPLKNLSI